MRCVIIYNERPVYKLYSIIQSNTQSIGNSEKYSCKIHGEYGIFKLPLNFGSKDHILEAFYYNISKLINSNVAYATVIKTRNGAGAFSRYEIPPGYGLVSAQEVLGAPELLATDIIDRIQLKIGNSAKIFNSILDMFLQDYIFGQADRHCENFSFLTKSNRVTQLYKMYDNGLCMCSFMSEDIALNIIQSGEPLSRLGNSEEQLTAIDRMLSLGYKSSLRLYDLNSSIIAEQLRKSDRFSEISQIRQRAMEVFICKRLANIRRLRLK